MIVGSNIEISFTAPDNNGPPIILYEIKCKKIDGLFTFIGDTTSTSNTYPISLFIGNPFYL